jgi:hypothetical protein
MVTIRPHFGWLLKIVKDWKMIRVLYFEDYINFVMDGSAWLGCYGWWGPGWGAIIKMVVT